MTDGIGGKFGESCLRFVNKILIDRFVAINRNLHTRYMIL